MQPWAGPCESGRPHGVWAAAAALALSAELLHLIFARPAQDLPVWDDANYFLAGLNLLRGNLAEALHVEWTPLLSYVAAAAWAFPGPSDPTWHFGLYRSAIQGLFLASAYVFCHAWTHRPVAAASCTLLVAIHLNLLRTGEIYLFCAACIMLIILRLSDARRLSLTAVACLLCLAVLVRKEFILAAVPAAAAGLVRRRQAGIPVIERADAWRLPLALALIVPVVIASQARDGFFSELWRGGRFAFAVVQKFTQYHQQTTRSPAPDNPDDATLFRAVFHLSPDEPIPGPIGLWRRNAAALTGFLGFNTRALLGGRIWPLGGQWLTWLACGGIVLWSAHALWHRLYWRAMLAGGLVLSLVPLVLVQVHAVYALHVFLFGLAALCGLLTPGGPVVRPATCPLPGPHRLWIVRWPGAVHPARLAPVGLALLLSWGPLRTALNERQPGELPRYAVARLLREAPLPDEGAGCVLAEHYPQAGKAFGLPRLDCCVPLWSVRQESDGTFVGIDQWGSPRPIDYALLESDQDALRVGGESRLRVIAARGPLRLVELRGRRTSADR